MLNFGQKVEERDSGATIPKDTLLLCSFVIRGTKNSKQTNGRFLDVELTVLPNQPYAGRKIWDVIADAQDGQNSQEFRDMAVGKIRRILEAVFGAKPDAPQSYTIQSYEQLNGVTVPVIVGVQKGKDGYDDKNTPDYLSPWSSIPKIVQCYNLLRQGVTTWAKPSAAPAGKGPGTATGGFAGTPPMAGVPAAPAAAAPAGPSWLAPTTATPTPAAQPPAGAPPAPVVPAPSPQPQPPQGGGFALPVGQPLPAGPSALPAAQAWPSQVVGAPQAPVQLVPGGDPVPFK